MQFGLRGPVFGVTSACSSANHAISAAVDQLRLGKADIMLAGGTDTPVVYGILKVWETLRVLARESCRPFSADRDGLVLSDGAGVAVLETLDHAKARGAPILAEVVGCGLSADAADIVTPTVEGPSAAMQACLDDAGLSTSAVDYINAHGTGTKANDRTETQAIRAVFGKEADRLSVSSTKSMHGHCLGASGAIELIACVNAIRHGIVPPTIGYGVPDPDCDLDITANVARERPVGVAMSNAFAFGGMNAVIALSAF
jgi:nodulation protein E